jgi:hypothetical protein
MNYFNENISPDNCFVPVDILIDRFKESDMTDTETLDLLLEHPDCPPAYLSDFMFSSAAAVRAVLRNIALDLLLLENPALIEEAAEMWNGRMIFAPDIDSRHPIARKVEQLNNSLFNKFHS